MAQRVESFKSVVVNEQQYWDRDGMSEMKIRKRGRLKLYRLENKIINYEIEVIPLFITKYITRIPIPQVPTYRGDLAGHQGN